MNGRRLGEPARHIDWLLTPGRLRETVNREPFGFQHNLSELGLFAIGALTKLAEKYAGHPQDYFVSMGASVPGEEFYTAVHGMEAPREALKRLDTGHYRILLKRPERHDPAFRVLFTVLLNEIVECSGWFESQRIVRAESAIFISSAATITPFHFDPETAFFSQIEGEKRYHVYSPEAVSEPELERFYRSGVLNIAQLDLARRNSSREHVFSLRPGMGFHQPQNAPHWVETGAARAVSYSVVFETDVSRAMGRTRAFNHYWRRLGKEPAEPGAYPLLDAGKASVMRVAFPMRSGLKRILRRKKDH